MVSVPPSSLEFVPRKEEYGSGDRLTLSVDRSNPEPRYRWVTAGDNMTASTSNALVIGPTTTGAAAFYVFASVTSPKDNVTWVKRERIHFTVAGKRYRRQRRNTPRACIRRSFHRLIPIPCKGIIIYFTTFSYFVILDIKIDNKIILL